MLRRHSAHGSLQSLEDLLRTMETWCADLLESHLSYPVLAYYRSQHDRESWLAALTSLLDVSAVIQASYAAETPEARALKWQAHLTFAMARHTVVDLALVFAYSPETTECSRLDSEGFASIKAVLQDAGLTISAGAEPALIELRKQYEPYLCGLSHRLRQELPPFWNASASADNWASTAWDNQHL
jgi:hypothetical protein